MASSQFEMSWGKPYTDFNSVMPAIGTFETRPQA